MDLWGRTFTRRELEGYTGDLRQIADIRLATLDDGAERGVRIADVRTGSGFDFTVLLDRAMDIGNAAYNGIPVAWHSGTGAAHPSRFEPRERGWLRTFPGGLLTLCGLSHAGAANDDTIDPENGERLNLHGRISHMPAHDVRIERVWTDDEHWVLRLHGVVDEASLFSYRLRLERTFEITPGVPHIVIQDRVRNMGGTPAPLMVLYHCNFGWPIVSPDSELFTPAAKVTARDATAETGIATWNKMEAPQPGYAEQVFYHHIEPSDTPQIAALLNRPLGLGVEMVLDTRTLTQLTEWKQMGYGDYVFGIEPGNCLPEGRIAARENGRLRMLAPGETETFNLGFRMLTSRREVDAAREASKHRLLDGVDE